MWVYSPHKGVSEIPGQVITLQVTSVWLATDVGIGWARPGGEATNPTAFSLLFTPPQ